MSLNGKVSVLLLLSNAVKYFSFLCAGLRFFRWEITAFGLYSCNSNGSD